MNEIRMNIKEEHLLTFIDMLSYNGFDDVKVTKYQTLKDAQYKPMYYVKARKNERISED